MLAGTALVSGSRSAFVDARGLRFHYLEWGDAAAPPVVLLHGLTGHAHTWDHVAEPLSRTHHLFVPDQRGHGDTQHADSYDTQDFVDDLEALCERWRLERFALVGLSMGGHNAIAYTAAHARRVSRLCIVDIAPAMDRSRAPNWEVISKLAESGHVPYRTFEEAFVAARAGNQTAPDENLRYRTMCNLNEQRDGTLVLKYDPKAPSLWRPADLWERVPAIAVPVLIVRGGLTTVLPRAQADRMAAAFPNAELVEVPDSGHSVPTDRPEKLAPILASWLARTG
jgi:pimeloyl-ACP methyl ester carboxylesterase